MIKIQDEYRINAQYVLDLQYCIGVLSGMNVYHKDEHVEVCMDKLKNIAEYHAKKSFLTEDEVMDDLEHKMGFNQNSSIAGKLK